MGEIRGLTSWLGRELGMNTTRHTVVVLAPDELAWKTNLAAYGGRSGGVRTIRGGGPVRGVGATTGAPDPRGTAVAAERDVDAVPGVTDLLDPRRAEQDTAAVVITEDVEHDGPLTR
jgi:hypothetical protein